MVVAQQGPSAPIDDAALRAVESRNQQRLSYGRDYYEQRFSPLDQINGGNTTSPRSEWPATQPQPQQACLRFEATETG